MEGRESICQNCDVQQTSPPSSQVVKMLGGKRFLFTLL